MHGTSIVFPKKTCRQLIVTLMGSPMYFLWDLICPIPGGRTFPSPHFKIVTFSTSLLFSRNTGCLENGSSILKFVRLYKIKGYFGYFRRLSFSSHRYFLLESGDPELKGLFPKVKYRLSYNNIFYSSHVPADFERNF